MKTVKDRRGREWETFIDRGYFDMTCVRWVEDKNFNSPTSFHFDTPAEAYQFMKLLEVSS
jgi:hypothetical protein